MAAARLAAMKERIKNKDQKGKAEKEMRVAELVKDLNTKEAEEKVRHREAVLEKLKEEAKNAAAKQAALELLQSQEPAAKRVRLDGMAVAAPKCSCSTPFEAVRETVKKAGAHLGRPFFKCPRRKDEQGCSFFVWEELLQREPEVMVPQLTSASGGDSNDVLCLCELAPKQFTVKKEGPNQGRSFYKCAEEKCRFFKWCDAGAANTSPSKAPGDASVSAGGLAIGGAQESASTTYQCSCGIDAVQRVAKKEGPNMGRAFWCCGTKGSGQCKFFKWDAPPASAAPA